MPEHIVPSPRTRLRDVKFTAPTLSYLVVVIAAVIISLIVYRRFLLEGYDFVLDGSMSDTVRILYPTYWWLYETLFERPLSFWSLQLALGTSLLSHYDVVFNPFTYVLYVFGKEHIGDMFLPVMILGIVAASIAMNCFLGTFRLSAPSRVLGSLTYSFCGWICLYATNLPWLAAVVYFPLLLKGVDILLRDGRARYLVLMTFLLSIYSFYFLWMSLLGALAYALARMAWGRSISVRNIVKGVVSVFLGMALGAFWLMPSLQTVLLSQRTGSGVTDPLALVTPSWQMLATGLTRLLGVDMFGVANEYSGWTGGYYELGTYVGLWVPVLASQFVRSSDVRMRRFFGVSLFLLSVSIAFPLVSWVFNGFSEITYRWTYVWLPIICLCVALGFDRAVLDGRFSVSAALVGALALSALGAITLVSAPILGSDSVGQRLVRLFFALCVMLSYTILFWIISRLMKTSSDGIANQAGWHRTFNLSIVGAVTCMLLVFDVVSNYRHWPLARDYSYEFSDMYEQSSGYFDEDYDIVRDIFAVDSTSYRIEKGHDSVYADQGVVYQSDNDAMVQGYYGLHGYNSLNTAAGISFLQNADIWVIFPVAAIPEGMQPQDMTGAHLNYINGVGDRWALMSFLGIKYYIAKTSDERIPPNYYVADPQLSTDSRTVYLNTNAYPMASLYTESISEAEYRTLSTDMKDRVLCSAVVLSEDSHVGTELSAWVADERDMSEVLDDGSSIQADRVKFTANNQGHYLVETRCASDGVLVIATPYEPDNWSVSVDGQEVAYDRVDCGLIGVDVPAGEHVVEVTYFPKYLKYGMGVSAASCVGVAAYAAAGNWSARRRRATIN